MKTVNDLFILEGMKECDILAGHRGLNRHVKFVNISDTPDVINFLDEYHLLLSTCYGFQDNSQALCHLIQQMHQRNCAGLIIKEYRFLKQLPEDVKLLADELAFPIIDLPSERTLGDLSRHISNYLNDHEAEQLYYALHVQKEFSEMMVKEYSINALVGYLAHFLDRQTFLLNHRGELKVHRHHNRSKTKGNVATEIQKIIQGNLVTAREGHTFTFSGEDYPDFTTFPIQTKRHFPSIFVILDAETLPYPSSQMAIEQAANVISFTLIKEQAIDVNARLLKNNFFADIIENRIQSDEEVINRVHYYGLNEDQHSVCVLCTIDRNTEHHETLQLYEKKQGELNDYIYDQIEDEIANNHLSGVLFTKERYFVTILQFPQYTSNEQTIVESFAESVQTNLDLDYTVSLGISYPIETSLDIPEAYREAVDAISYGYDLHEKNFIRFYKAREFTELLSTIPKKDLSALYSNTLKDLAFPQTKENQELLRTIKTYLDNQCEISKTSRQLFVHRNTVKYRIKKAEEMLNCTLNDPIDSLSIRVALVIHGILNTSY